MNALICFIALGGFMVYGLLTRSRMLEEDAQKRERHKRALREQFRIEAESLKETIARMHDDRDCDKGINAIIGLFQRYRQLERISDFCGELSALVESKRASLNAYLDSYDYTY